MNHEFTRFYEYYDNMYWPIPCFVFNEKNVVKQWTSEQNKLKEQLILEDNPDWNIDDLRFIGGVDISYVKDNDSIGCVVYSASRMIRIDCPYIPGFLAFRECGHLVSLFEEMKRNCNVIPDLVLVDGNGVLHPHGFGLASHLGVRINCPTIGIGKSLLHIDGLTKERMLATIAQHRGASRTMTPPSFPLVGDSGAIHGSAVLTTNKIKNPIVISIGHRISLATSIKVVMKCSKFRVPEPVRLADQISRRHIRIYVSNT